MMALVRCITCPMISMCSQMHSACVHNTPWAGLRAAAEEREGGKKRIKEKNSEEKVSHMNDERNIDRQSLWNMSIIAIP